MKENVVRAVEMALKCDYKGGSLPDCAPLAAAYVPVQQKNPPKYAANEALTRGTLFPGLDLPFKNIANTSNPYAGTPLGEIMALSFVIKELNLYLDTHKDDREAFSTLQEVVELYEDGCKKYVKQYGPLSLKDLKYSEEYDWLCDPWPWEYKERMGRR